MQADGSAFGALPVAFKHLRARGERRQDWGDAPDVLGVVNRIGEMRLLRGWVLDEHCRLVAVLGMGGIAKTMLAAQLAQEVAPSFERVYWRSLRGAPSTCDWHAGAIGFLSDQQMTPPWNESAGRRCLLVLDNFEVLLETGDRDGRYREGLAGYGRLLEALGDAAPQSCVVLTGREAPAELAVVGGSAVRTLQLGGLGADAVRMVLAPKRLVGTSQQRAELTARFSGNSLALKMAGESIGELFDGDIGTCLKEAGACSLRGVFDGFLTEHLDRSSAVEQQVLRMLGMERGPVKVTAARRSPTDAAIAGGAFPFFRTSCPGRSSTVQSHW